MATRAWVAAAVALNPQLLPLRSCSPTKSVSPAQRSASMGLRLRSGRPCVGKFVCRRAKNAGYEDYKFPDPIPEFAEQVSLPLPLPHAESGPRLLLLLLLLFFSDGSHSFGGAFQETSKFREHMAWRLEQKKEDYFGDHVEEIVDVCTEARTQFLKFQAHSCWFNS
jgi:hypothetical protein